MSNIKYAIYCRYDYWGRNGKEWSNWFVSYGTRYFDSESEANAAMKQKIEQSKVSDKISKTNREFKVEPIDIDLLPKPAPPKEKKKRGRPKKNAAD